MIKAVGIWGLSNPTTAAAGATAVYLTPMRGIYQPLLWLVTMLGVR